MTTMLKSALIGLSAFSLASATACAENEPALDTTLTMEEATEGPSNVALWKTGDADTTIYMMGTIHILKPGLAWETDAFEAAWLASDTAFFEANVTSPEEVQAAGPIVLSEGFFTDGRVLADLFTEDQIATIDAGLSDFGLTVKALGNMRPWFVSIQITQLAMSKIGGDPNAGIEMILSARAVEEQKDQRFFESVADQVQLIASISDDVWAKSLVEGIEEISDIEGYFAHMVGLWYQGDADGLAEFMAESWEETPELKETLLSNRNKAWAEELDTIIENETGTFFVAVGAGHLAGDDSVQDYLAEHGHKSVRVNP